jgi:hypothetical protein
MLEVLGFLCEVTFWFLEPLLRLAWDNDDRRPARTFAAGCFTRVVVLLAITALAFQLFRPHKPNSRKARQVSLASCEAPASTAHHANPAPCGKSAQPSSNAIGL